MGILSDRMAGTISFRQKFRGLAVKGLSSDERQRLEDIGFMTCMTLVLLGNYAQTGHFGGPLAYTPFNVAMHLVGPERGGLAYDYRRPKHPKGCSRRAGLRLSPPQTPLR